MENNQIIISVDRGLISLTGTDVKDFLQNILSNDVDKVDVSNSVFSAILSTQGKYLYEFFIIKFSDGYLLDCENELTKEIIAHLNKYKLRSKVEIKDFSSKYVVGIINLKKFEEIQVLEKKKYRNYSISR